MQTEESFKLLCKNSELEPFLLKSKNGIFSTNRSVERSTKRKLRSRTPEPEELLITASSRLQLFPERNLTAGNDTSKQ